MTTELNQEIKPLTPHELADARQLEQAATPGPWRWRIDRGGHGGAFLQTVGHGGLLILDAVRNGMQGATLRFRDHAKCLMFKAHDRESHLDDNPDARFLAAARTLVPRLIATIDRMTGDGFEDLDEIKRLRQEMALEKQAADEEIARLRDELRVALGHKPERDLPVLNPWDLLDQAQAAHRKLEQERDTYAEQLAGTLALLAETRQALVSNLSDAIGCNSDPLAWAEMVRETCEKALSLAAPEALREREDRMAALERAVNEAESALNDVLEAPERPTKATVNGWFWRFKDACEMLAALDAKKGGR